MLSKSLLVVFLFIAFGLEYSGQPTADKVDGGGDCTGTDGSITCTFRDPDISVPCGSGQSGFVGASGEGGKDKVSNHSTSSNCGSFDCNITPIPIPFGGCSPS